MAKNTAKNRMRFRGPFKIEVTGATYTVSKNNEIFVSLGNGSPIRTAQFGTREVAARAMKIAARAASKGDFAPTMALRFGVGAR